MLRFISEIMQHNIETCWEDHSLIIMELYWITKLGVQTKHVLKLYLLLCYLHNRDARHLKSTRNQ